VRLNVQLSAGRGGGRGRAAVGARRGESRAAWSAAAWLAAGLVAAPAGAQSYVVHSYRVMDGLPAPAVHALAQDASGVMWFATRAGIAASDGVGWTTHPDPASPPTHDFRHLTRDEQGAIWAASHRLGRLLRRSPAGWEALPDPPRPAGSFLRATALAVGGTGSEAFAGVGCGVGGGLFLWRDGGWAHVGTAQGLPSPIVRGVAAWREVLYVATAAGPARVSRQGVAAPLAGAPPDAGFDLQALAATAGPVEDGGSPPDLWLLGRRALGRLRGGAFQEIARGFELGPFEVDSPAVVLPDPPRAVYCASAYLIMRVDLGSGAVERLGERNGLASDGAAALLLDREGNVWVGGPRGADKLVSRRFGSYRQAHGLLSNEVSAIAEPGPGTLVFGHNTGLTVLRDGTFHRLPFVFSESNPAALPRVLDLASDGRGGAWGIAAGRGLLHLGRALRLEWFQAPRPHAGYETSLLVERDGSVLVAARKGVLRFDGRSFSRPPDSTRYDAYVRRMARGRDGTLYLATSTRGVLALRGERLQALPGADEPGARSAYALREDGAGRLWVGTQVGLFVVREGSLARPAEAALRVTEPVYFVSAATPGTLWLGTDRGVLRWDGSRLQRFTPREGLAGWETNRAAGFADSDGRIWIGTEDGVSVHRGEPDPAPPPAPLVAVTAIEAGDRSYASDHALELPHDRSTLTFRFRAVSWLDERAIAVRCRLDGLEEAWSAELPPRTREVRYVNLPPGRYLFRVQAANAAGAWSEVATSSPVTIRRPLWTEWWFRLLAALGTVLAAAAAVKLAVRWRYAHHLESEVARRTAALRESESRYRQLFRDPQVPKLLVDPETGRVLDANDSASSLFPLGGSAVGHGVDEALIPGLPGAVRGAAAGRESGFVAQVAATAAGPRELELRVGPIELGGEVRVLVHAQDVTERRRLEEERIKASKLESMSLLAGGLAHDFNNLLMSIVSHLGVARQRMSRGLDVTGSLDVAESALMRASGLTRQLLTFARGGDPERRLVGLDALLRETAGLALAGSRSTCASELPEDLWPTEVDPGQIAQVISNLILNASQAMPRGGKVTVHGANVPAGEAAALPLPPGRYVRIAVSDEGVGIPSELVDKVFDPYFTTKEQGRGLGLASSHSIIRRHGGHIRVDSTVGVGTTVTVYLPAADP
jgi:PAS domain S-box-containing protein